MGQFSSKEHLATLIIYNGDTSGAGTGVELNAEGLHL
jgi:hypothetical protein